jgi:hypothetical protein
LAIAADAAVERDFICFSQFGAPIEIILNVATGSDCFDLWAVFVLGAESDGINPLTEAVTLSVGSSKWVIPPGIFRVDHLGSYKAQTTVGRTLFDVMIQSRRRNEFEFRASAARAGLVDITNLVPLGLAIGDDHGEATVLAETWPCSPRLKDD